MGSINRICMILFSVCFSQSSGASLCSMGATSGRTLGCIQELSIKGMKALEPVPVCQDYISWPLLHCLFRQEVGSFEAYLTEGYQMDKYCTNSGCGLSQMTEKGVSSVQTVLKNPAGVDIWNRYWEGLGVPTNNIKPPQSLQRTDAMEPYYGVIMTILHLCREVDSLLADQKEVNNYTLAFNYNGNPKHRGDYAKAVEECSGGPTAAASSPQKSPDSKASATASKTGSSATSPLPSPSKKSTTPPTLVLNETYTFYNIPGMGVIKIYTSDLPKIKEWISMGKKIGPGDFNFPQ